MKEMLYAVRCLKSNEDMILALAGQFKQLLLRFFFFFFFFCHETHLLFQGRIQHFFKVGAEQVGGGGGRRVV